MRSCNPTFGGSLDTFSFRGRVRGHILDIDAQRILA
jgi:hypothetical protein